MFSELTEDLLDLHSRELGSDPLLACGVGEVNIGAGDIEICIVLSCCSGCCSSSGMRLV